LNVSGSNDNTHTYLFSRAAINIKKRRNNLFVSAGPKGSTAITGKPYRWESVCDSVFNLKTAAGDRGESRKNIGI
jgi:hypothetical protein